ncbi:MAG: hypothetical protein PUG32_06850 [Bacteroidales bacterium]|nr:hypothetical protein [Bacteroidales bacterium]
MSSAPPARTLGAIRLLCGGQPATTSGVAIWGRRSCSGHVATPRVAQYPATHSCNPCRGGGNVRLWSSSPPMAALAAVALLTQR